MGTMVGPANEPGAERMSGRTSGRRRCASVHTADVASVRILPHFGAPRRRPVAPAHSGSGSDSLAAAAASVGAARRGFDDASPALGQAQMLARHQLVQRDELALDERG